MRSRQLWVTAGLPAAAIGVALWDPARHGGPPLCPWKGLTGTECPGCGLTRAAGSLLRGRVGEAFDLHPLVGLVAVQLAALWFVAVFLRRPVRSTSPAVHSRWARPAWVTPAVLAANGAVFVAVWAGRLATGALPSA